MENELLLFTNAHTKTIWTIVNNFAATLFFFFLKPQIICSLWAR